MPDKYRKRCYLNNPRRVRLMMTKIARMMYGDDPEALPLDEARLMLSYLTEILKAFRQESEQDLDDRLSELERRVEARNG